MTMAMLSVPKSRDGDKLGRENTITLAPSVDATINDLGHDFEKIIRLCIQEAKKSRRHLNQENEIPDIGSFFSGLPIFPMGSECLEEFDEKKGMPHTPISSECQNKPTTTREDRKNKMKDTATGKEKASIDVATVPNFERVSISNKTNTLRNIPKKTRVKMTRVKRKKWKMAGDNLINFDYPLLSKRYTNSDLEEEEMNKELVTFEKNCKEEQQHATIMESEEEKCKTASDALENKENDKELKKCPTMCDNFQNSEDNLAIIPSIFEKKCDEKKPGAISSSRPYNRDNDKRYFETYKKYDEATDFQENYSSILDLEQKISKQERICMNRIYGNMPKIHFRTKKKWKIQKTRKQIKSKNCTELTIGRQGQKLFMHFRLYKKLEISEWSRKQNFIPTPKKLYVEAERKLYRRVGRPGYGLPRGDGYSNSRNETNHQVNSHLINAYNADGALEADLVNILMNLQNRDLTPEDYETLLRLDDSVAPQTIDSNLLEAFKTDKVTEELIEQSCQICMDDYAIGEIRKHLPCGHVFHAFCIDNWLGNSSPNCPLDGLSVSVS